MTIYVAKAHETSFVTIDAGIGTGDKDDEFALSSSFETAMSYAKDWATDNIKNDRPGCHDIVDLVTPGPSR